MHNEKKYTLLCLGDSYTIGEAVNENERFPVQTVSILNKEDIHLDAPVIIAKTGWTTDELAGAIKEWGKHDAAAFNKNGNEVLVTLLIGVNNEFRGRSEEEYRKEFVALLHTAIQYAGGKTNHVFVLSIPDWGLTPFAAGDPKQRTATEIGNEIDRFNAINKEESLKAKANYIDITPVSRQAQQNPELIASDGLHPSGKMYSEWAKLLAAEIKKVVADN